MAAYDWDLWGSLIAAAACLLCAYVIFSYWRFPEHRKQPAPMMLYKTICDFFFSLLVTVMISIDVEPETISNAYEISLCSVLGGITSLLYFVGQGYFAALCLDLRQTLLNPFREPLSKSSKIHYFIWFLCLPIVIIVLCFGGFQYRIDYEICFICYTGNAFNVFKVFLIYVPLIGSNLIGIITLIHARFRLKQGLPSTLKSRKMVVTRQSILVLWFNIALLLILILISIPINYDIDNDGSYISKQISNDCIIYETSTNGKVAHGTIDYFPISFVGLLFCNPIADAGAFICINLSCVNPYIAKKKKLENKSKNTTKYKKHKNSTNETKFLRLLSNDNNNNNHNNNDGIGSLSSSLTNRNLNEDSHSGFEESLLGVNHEDDSEFDPVLEEISQNLSDALRFECVALMTAGVSQAIKTAANETYTMNINNDGYGGGNDHEDELYEMHMPVSPPTVNTMLNNMQSSDSHFVSSNTFFKNAGVSARSGDIEMGLLRNAALLNETSHITEDSNNPVFNILNATEPPPPRAFYPSKITSNAGSKGIINAFKVDMGTVVTTNSRHASIVDDRSFHEIRDSLHSNNPENEIVPFRDYAPHVFRYLRTQVYGVNDTDYLKSIRPTDSRKDILALAKAKFSEGKSGSFFFTTHDSKYIMKTISKEEAMFLIKLLPNYVKYFEKYKESRINQFYGFYSMKLYNYEIFFVIINNVLLHSISNECEPNELYDIKGSWINRLTSYHAGSGKLMKDLDFRRKIKLEKKQSKRLFVQIRKDCQFLESQNIMDYSLLLAIYFVSIDSNKISNNNNNNHGNNNNENEMNGSGTFKNRKHTVTSNVCSLDASIIEGPGIYDVGIIDILQAWNNSKKMERFFKVYFRCMDSKGISCIQPNEYKNRFLRKLKTMGIGT